MKGLLLKELYLFWHHGRLFILLAAIMAAISAFGGTIGPMLSVVMFFGIYPMTLQAYDERSKWPQYALTLTYSRSDLVNIKYILVLILALVSSVIAAAVSCISGIIYDKPMSLDPIYLSTLFVICLLMCSVPSLMLPFVFWLGAEKGRLLYCIFGGLIGAAGGMLSSSSFVVAGIAADVVSSPLLIPGLLAAATALFGASWLLSLKLFKRREL